MELIGRHDECAFLDQLLERVQSGESRTLVIHGEPESESRRSMGYTAQCASTCSVLRISGIQSKVELAFAALHQLCAPLLDRLHRLPAPQREALQTAFGLTAEPAPDLFLTGLAVMGLLSETGERQPLICLIDNQQWLDRASAQALAFAARRLLADSVALVFAARTLGRELVGLPQLELRGLSDAEAHALLDKAFPPPLDSRVRNQIVAEAVRSGSPAVAVDALARLVAVTSTSGTDWALGVQARCQALLADGPDAEAFFRIALERLSRTRMRVELARVHLLYGEWLRRERRRTDTRPQLRTAHRRARRS